MVSTEKMVKCSRFLASGFSGRSGRLAGIPGECGSTGFEENAWRNVLGHGYGTWLFDSVEGIQQEHWEVESEMVWDNDSNAQTFYMSRSAENYSGEQYFLREK